MAEFTPNINLEVNHADTEKVSTYLQSVSDNFTKIDEAYGIATQLVLSLYGQSGEVTLLTTDWVGMTCTKTFADMGENDLIVFTPSTKNDKTNFEVCNPFVSSNGNIVTFEVESVPSADITLKFFITRGTL